MEQILTQEQVERARLKSGRLSKKDRGRNRGNRSEPGSGLPDHIEREILRDT